MSIGQTLLLEFDAEMENTRRMLAAIPEGKWDWKPHQKSMSLGVLAGHIAELTSWGSETINTDGLTLTSDSYKPSTPSSSSELLEVFEKSKSGFRQALTAAPDEAMFKNWSMTWDGQKVLDMPRVAVLRAMVMNHLIHHRGQLSVYLRLLDIPVPGVYGPTADDKAQ